MSTTFACQSLDSQLFVLRTAPHYLGAIVYYQKALFTISNRPGVFEFEDKAISLTDSTARNYMFMASNVLAMVRSIART